MTEYTHRIRYSETDSTGCLSLSGLLRLFQDFNYLGAEDAGRGIVYQDTHGAAWYLLAWDVHCIALPRLSETVTFTSCFYQLSGALAKKYMTLTDEKGDVLAYALTRWSYVNKADGTPMPFPEGYWEGEEILPCPPAFGTMKRLRPPTSACLCNTLVVDDDLIDENGHVNNVRFSELALSLFGKNHVDTFGAEFLRQTRLGDMLTAMRSNDDNGSSMLTFLASDGKPNAIFTVK